MMLPMRWITALAVSLLATIAHAEAIDYAIKLVRPPMVGQKYTLSADGALTRQTLYSLPNKKTAVANEGFAIHLEGTVEVLEVNGDGEESKSACTIKTCKRITAEGETELLAAGRVVTATGGKQDTTYSIDQGELSPEAITTLDLVLRLGEDDGFNDDLIYGTNQRLKVGDSWELDKQAAADEAKADDVHIEPAAIKGSMKIEAVEKTNDVECLKITGNTSIKSMQIPPPEGMKGGMASLAAKYTGLYPIDLSKSGPLRESLSVTHRASFHGKSADGQEIHIRTKMQRAAELKRSYLSK